MVHQVPHHARRRAAERLVATIPHDELPDDRDRAALVEAVFAGDIEHVYRPFGASYTNVCVSDLPPYVDQRMRVVTWATMRRDGKDAAAIRRAMLDEYERATHTAIARLSDLEQGQEGLDGQDCACSKEAW